MNKYKVIIIDDERLAREEVKMHLREYEDFEVVATAENADEAEGLICTLNPELIFWIFRCPGNPALSCLSV